LCALEHDQFRRASYLAPRDDDLARHEHEQRALGFEHAVDEAREEFRLVLSAP